MPVEPAPPSAARAAALARFELGRRMRARSTVGAALLFVLVAGTGAWREVGSFAGYAWTVAALVVLRFGFGGDRRHGFDACLAGNFLSAGELLLARTAAFAVSALALGACSLVAGVVLTGSPERAAWQAVEYTLVAALASPAILLVELTLSVRMPFAVVVLLYLACLLVAEPFVGAEAVIRATGFPARPFVFAELKGLAVRVGLFVPPALALLVPLHRWRSRTA